MKHIQYFKQFASESNVHYFGPSAEDEKKAAQSLSKVNSKPWKNGNSFKTILKKDFLKGDLGKISNGRITITPGNWKRLTFKTNKADFNLEEINKVWSPALERFGKVYYQAKSIRIEEFTPSSFVLTFGD